MRRVSYEDHDFPFFYSFRPRAWADLPTVGSSFLPVVAFPKRENKSKERIWNRELAREAVRKSLALPKVVVYNENPEVNFVKSDKFSYAIVVVGEHTYAKTFGASLNLTIAELGPTTITKMYLWLRAGTEGQVVVDFLYGDYEFTGKLARTLFKTIDQLPMNAGDKCYDLLFQFGFGFTKTSLNIESSCNVSKNRTLLQLEH
ncbi:hydrolase protein [Spatholobus suberectus]|nr:hydrolase protein [Spatholobus suberectus]